jgi:hypothetical protein
MTTLPAKTGSFRVVRKRLLQQELLRLRLWQPATLTPEGSIQAYGRPKATGFLPSRGEVLNAISTAAHPKGPKPPSKRDTSIGLRPIGAYSVEPPERIAHVKVPSESCHNVGRLSSNVRRERARRSRGPHSLTEVFHG